MQILGLKVHEILYVECCGVSIMFLDEFADHHFITIVYPIHNIKVKIKGGPKIDEKVKI